MKSDANKIFAKNMRLRRKELNLSQEKLGELSGLHRTYIGGIEQYNRNPTLESMRKIAEALDIDVSLLTCKDYTQFDSEYTLCVHEDDDYKFFPIEPEELDPEIKDFLDKLTS